jgi:hypothetical protein
VLKNSNFSVDRNLGGRRRARLEFRQGLGLTTGFAACGPRRRLAVTMNRTGDVRRKKSEFWRPPIFRVFQPNRPFADGRDALNSKYLVGGSYGRGAGV